MPLLIQPTTLFKRKRSLVPPITTYQVPKRNCCCDTSVFLMLICFGFRLLCVITSGSRTPLLWLLFTVGLSLLVHLGLPLVTFGALNARLVIVQKHILVQPKASPQHCNQQKNMCWSMGIPCQVVVSQWTITCPLLWDNYPTLLDVNGMDALVAHFLFTMPVESYSIFVNTLLLQLRPSPINAD